jgi:hypothetical protein
MHMSPTEAHGLVSVYNCKLPPLQRVMMMQANTSIRAISTFFIIHCKGTPVQSMANFFVEGLGP